MSNKNEQEESVNRSYSKEDEAVINLLKTVDHINRISSETMEPFGITSHQYNILRILRGADSAGLPTLEIGERMLVRSPGVTRLVDRLEKKELVTRKRSEEDRRVVHCQITDKGRNLLEKMDEPIETMNQSIVENLNLDQLEKLIELLQKLRE